MKNRLKVITIKRLLGWSPCDGCDTKSKLLQVSGGKASMTPQEVAELNIPAEDKVWVLLRPEVLGNRNYKKVMFTIADRAVTLCCLDCGIDKVETWAKNWLNGSNRSSDAAYCAARAAYHAANAAYHAANAAYCAARAAAYAAAYNTYNAARVAYHAERTVNIARAAANAAANAAIKAANAAARKAEREWQLELIKKYL